MNLIYRSSYNYCILYTSKVVSFLFALLWKLVIWVIECI